MRTQVDVVQYSHLRIFWVYDTESSSAYSKEKEKIKRFKTLYKVLGVDTCKKKIKALMK